MRVGPLLGAAWLAAALLGLAAPPAVATAMRRDGRTAQRSASMTTDAECIECHADVARQWRGSSHQTSYVDPTFQEALDREPRAYCRACHAPLSKDGAMVDAHAAQTGVGCTSCHLRDGVVLAGTDDARAGVAPHAITRTSELGTAVCASCHEFPFPDLASRDRPLLMQRTAAEHAASPFADVACIECHMPTDDVGRRGHGFVASRDPDFVRSAVRIDATRTDATTIRVTLRAADVGHAFPTGDLLRRVEIGAAAVGDDARVTRRFLARHFADRVQASGAKARVEVADDRVPAGGERTVELVVPEGDGRPIRWWALYQRVSHERSFDPADAATSGAITLAGGILRHSSPP